MAQILRGGLPQGNDTGAKESGRGGLSCGVPGIGESACAHGKGPAEIAAETARIQQQTTDEWLADYGYVEGEEKY